MKASLVTWNGLVCLLVRRTSPNLCLVLLTLFACLTELAHAAPAALDATFGIGGKVITDIPSSTNAEANSAAIQPDGRILVAGTRAGAFFGFALVRYTNSGTLDTTFNGTGIVDSPIGGNAEARGVAVQSDGRIVVGGAFYNGSDFDFLVVRYNSDGTLDTTFNGTGFVVTSLGGSELCYSMALQRDGKIVLAGYSDTDGDFNTNAVVLARYTSTGAPDTSFNGTGSVITDLGVASVFILAVALQDDGKIVVAGSYPLVDRRYFAVFRYTSAGALDTSFSGDGQAVTDVGGGNDNHAFSVAVQSDGKIVLAGQSAGNFALVRHFSDGSFDTGFGLGGVVISEFGGADDSARGVAVQRDGRIVAVGIANNDFALARYAASDGAPDPSFNVTGRVTTDFGGDRDGAIAVALQSNGRIVVAGYGTPSGSFNTDFAVARYEGDPVPPPEINVTSNGLAIPDGDTMPRVADQTDFGSESIHGGFSVHFFTIENTGAGPLQLYSPTVAITGPHAADFVVTTFPPTTLSPGGSTTFSVRFDPSAVGLRQATILIASTDSDESSYEFAVQGLGVVFPGEEDPTFDEDGKVTADFGSSDIGAGVAVQSDDKIVVAIAGASEFVLARYTSAGVLDMSFNGTGKVTTNPGGVVSTAQSVAIQSDGRIVVAGLASNGSNFDFAVVRYTSTGALDTTFNGTGFVITPIGSSHDEAYAVAVQNDGKIVVAGYSLATNANFAVVRYTSGGALDPGFNGTGIRTLNVSGDDVARAVAIQTDGNIVVVGYSDPRPIGPTDPPARFSLARFTSAGAMNGTVSTPIGNGDFAHSVAIQCDGKIIVGGSALTENSQDIALVRYHPNLTLDTSFNLDGIVTTDVLGQFTDDAAYGVAVQADGKIVVGGTSYYDFALLRYATNGGEDFGFGPARTNITTIGSGTNTAHSADVAYGLAIQSDGKIVLAGVAEIPSAAYSDLALVRYVNNTPRQFFDNVVAAAGLNGAEAQPTATPFGDGVPNLLKYAFQMNLAGPDVHALPVGLGDSGLPIAQLVNIGGQTFYQFEFIRRKGSGLIYTSQKSTTLAPGSFVPMTGAITVQNLGAECERVIVLEPVDLRTTPNFFSRLQLTLPP